MKQIKYMGAVFFLLQAFLCCAMGKQLPQAGSGDSLKRVKSRCCLQALCKCKKKKRRPLPAKNKVEPVSDKLEPIFHVVSLVPRVASQGDLVGLARSLVTGRVSPEDKAPRAQEHVHVSSGSLEAIHLPPIKKNN